MKDELMIDDGCGWAVAGVLTELEGAVLTTTPGDGGLAGSMNVAGSMSLAANDTHFESREGELG